METAWVAISVTVSIFVITHIVVTVWWASRVNTAMEFIERDLKNLIVELRAMKDVYAKKEDLVVIQKNQDAMWKKIDYLIEKGGNNG